MREREWFCVCPLSLSFSLPRTCRPASSTSTSARACSSGSLCEWVRERENESERKNAWAPLSPLPFSSPSSCAAARTCAPGPARRPSWAAWWMCAAQGPPAPFSLRRGERERENARFSSLRDSGPRRPEKMSAPSPIRHLFITLRRGLAGVREDHRAVVASLGLRKREQTVRRRNDSALRGAVEKVCACSIGAVAALTGGGGRCLPLAAPVCVCTDAREAQWVGVSVRAWDSQGARRCVSLSHFAGG